MPVHAIPSLPGYTAGPQPIDHDQLCWDDYWSLVLFPVIGEAFAPFKDKAPDPVGMCRAGYRAVFWYCYDNQWPCCGEQDLVDGCWARAEEMMGYMFEQAVNQAAKQAVIDEILAEGLPAGGCEPGGVAKPQQTGGPWPPPPGAPQRVPRAPTAIARRSGGMPVRGRTRRAALRRRQARVG